MKKLRLVSILLILFIFAFSERAYANNYNLDVKNDGKNVTMTSKDTQMEWSLNNLLPGQKDVSTVNIKNTGNKSVSVKTTIEIQEDNGLLEMIDLSIKDSSEKELYVGKYKDFNAIYKVMAANESETYTVTTSMNVNAGNEYQSKNYKLKFNFTASGDVTPIGTLTVKYVDENGKDILPSEVETKYTTEQYNLPAQGKKIEGYKFVTVEGELTGYYKEEGTIVTYKYKKIKNQTPQKPEEKPEEVPEQDPEEPEQEKKKGNVIILCVDESNKPIKRTVYTEYVGTEYNFGNVGEEIDGYEFVGVEGATSGKYKEEDTYIIYRYKRKGPAVTTVSPQTGDRLVIYLIIISCVAAILSVILIHKIRDNHKENEK